MIDLEKLRDYCLSKKGTSEGTPFGIEHAVFKVGDKIFAILALDETPARINLKCDPNKAIELRQQNPSIIPGYHMNKKHWNTLILDNNIPDYFLYELLDHSYELVLDSLPKKKQTEIIGI